MIFTITNAGLLAANQAQAGGPKINITTFKVGSAVNYSPQLTDTDLHGTVLFSQAVNGYAVLSAHEVEYTLTLDDSVGDFQFGEIGIYLEDGTLFALASLTEMQTKTKTTLNDTGNIVSIEAHLVFTQLAATITFPINQIANAKMLETLTVDLLKPPAISDSNAYLTMSKDSGGSSIPAFKSADFEWGFPSFTRIFEGVVTGNGKNYTQATVSFVGGNPTRPATGTATLLNGAVTAITLTDQGAGYTSAPAVDIQGDGVGAEATAVLTQGVTDLQVVNGGVGYTSAPTVTLSGGGGTGATATAIVSGGAVTGFTITSPGSGYTSAPTATISGGGGSGATATAAISGIVGSAPVFANSASRVLCADLATVVTGVVPGKYIVEFLSGPLAGYARLVTASTSFSMDWATASPTGSPPAVGANFTIWQANASLYNAQSMEPQPPEYDPLLAYTVKRTVTYQNQLWRCHTDTPAGAFNPAHWTRVLGTAAASTLQTSVTDATAGSVLTTGAFGVGGVSVSAPSNDLDQIVVGGLYSVDGTTVGVPGVTPAVSAGSQVVHMSASSGTIKSATQVLLDLATDRMFHRRRDAAGSWQAWVQLANMDSPVFTGTPKVPTAAPGTATEQAASTAFVLSSIASAPHWTVVASGYVAQSGDRVMLNNRVESPSLLLPANPDYGQEIQMMPYPFTQYSKFPVSVSGNGHPIMGLNETMALDEDNVMCSCKFLGKLKGWIVEKMGYSGNSFTIKGYLAAAYGANAIQKFDARIVKGAPLVLMVHGGGWISGNRVAANLASGGYVQQFPDKYGIGFASIDYTLADATNRSYPTAVNDVIAAADYFKNTLGVTDIHILGTSAGANLAALAVIARPDLFTSFIGYYGAYDLTKLAQFSADVQTDIGQYTADAAAASPTLHAGAWTTPSILIHGDADTTVNIQQSIDFGTVIGVTPIVVPGAAHAFTIFGDPTVALPSYGKSVFNFIDKVTEQ